MVCKHVLSASKPAVVETRDNGVQSALGNLLDLDLRRPGEGKQRCSKVVSGADG